MNNINNTYMNHFNSKSSEYQQFRPTYPEKLFKYLVGLTAQQQYLWDVGTGTGQAAVALSPYFKKIIATDLNQAQLDVAPKKDNIEYIASPSEKTSIADHSLDLITVAQALHWFDLPAFYTEVKRTLKPNGILAVWCYSLFEISPKIDQIIQHLYADILGDAYWPKERRYIDDKFKTILFPFAKLETPKFIIERPLNLYQCVGYLNTWSALKDYQDKNQGKNPLDFIIADLEKAWGEPENKYLTKTEIHLLCGTSP